MTSRPAKIGLAVVLVAAAVLMFLPGDAGPNVGSLVFGLVLVGWFVTELRQPQVEHRRLFWVGIVAGLLLAGASGAELVLG